MKNHDDEKSALEEAAVGIFVDLYNLNREDHLEVIERRERPDYILKSIKDGLVALEVTHLFYDADEAKMLFGRSAEEMHGLEKFSKLYAGS